MPVRDDMNLLIKAAGEMAHGLLKKDHAFLPFAVALDVHGNTCYVAGTEEAPKAAPQPEEVLRWLRSDLRQGAAAGQYRATAVASNVDIRSPESGNPVPAVRVQLEHVDGEPLTCYVPYFWSRHGGVSALAPRIDAGDRMIFDPEAG